MFKYILALLALTASFTSAIHENYTQVGITPVNNCVQFSVASGTGCAWMCNYCASILNTNNYYFTTPVCSWDITGCVGNPVEGLTYECCAN